ncbi:hypothetical protein BMS3Abin17_00236 [archaeon BMS3Abin17]|nr:hypothetical protein BMS3Abin17_00236 [archaeon BMS3Abin17]HDZ60804.1 hypothetical protein [Candidatus Pacearchaeota archaeon]
MEIGFTLFVVAALIIAIWVIVEIKRLKHKLFAVFLITLILFTYISFSLTLKNHNLDLKTISGVVNAGKLYFTWLGSVFVNLKSLTANIIKMDWSGNDSSIR